MQKPIHICVLTSAHPIDDVRVNYKICQAFHDEGYFITWVGPNSAIFDTNHNDHFGINYHLFASIKGKVGRIFGGIKLFFAAVTIPNVQVYYAPDPDSAWVAVHLAHRQKTHVIFDIHEMFNDAMFDRWAKGLVAKIAKEIFKHLLLKVCSKCDLVMGVNQAVLEPYQLISNEKMIIRSCTPLWFAAGGSADLCNITKKTFTFFHGKANLSRGTQTVLEALSIVNKQIEGIRCIMINTLQNSPEGFSIDNFHQQLVKLDLQNVVELHQGISLQEMPTVLCNCDVGLIAYGRRLGIDSLPNRLFEYMAVGLPVIVPNYSKEICQIIETEKCGLMIDFENPHSLAEAMIHLRKDIKESCEMGRRAREAFIMRHNWEVEVRPLLDKINNWFPDKE